MSGQFTDTGSVSPISAQNNLRANIAVASLVIGLFALPVYIVGFILFLFVALMLLPPWPIFVLALPILFCVVGMIAGLIGLRSKRWLIALIGLVLCGLMLIFEVWQLKVLVVTNL